MDQPTIDGINSFFISLHARQSGLKAVLASKDWQNLNSYNRQFSEALAYLNDYWHLPEYPVLLDELQQEVSAAAADVLAGHLPLCIANIDSLMGQVSAGKLKPIASTGATRATVAPDTPTLAETVPDLVVTSWSIWAVPAGTPAKIKDKLRTATERALKDAEVIASMRQGGFEPGAGWFICRKRPLASLHKALQAEPDAGACT